MGFVDSNTDLVLLTALFFFVLIVLAKDKLVFRVSSKVTEGKIVSLDYVRIDEVRKTQIEYMDDSQESEDTATPSL